MEAKPMQPAPQTQAVPIQPKKVKKPKRGRSGEQEMGVV